MPSDPSVRQTKVKLRTRGDIPWDLEHKLVTKGGFAVIGRFGKDWIIFEKKRVKVKPNFELLIEGELPEDIQRDLLNRCNNIMHMFPNPLEHRNVIMMRLENIARSVPPIQGQFVRAWSRANVLERKEP